MKYSPVLVLGLTTLALSSTSAYANEPLNFDPGVSSASAFLSASAPIANTNPEETAIPGETTISGDKSIAPFKIERLNEPPIAVSDREGATEAAPALPDLPLFELPPFQAPSLGSSPADRPEPTPSPSAQPAPDSPFELPEHLTEADLFEPEIESGPIEPERLEHLERFESVPTQPRSNRLSQPSPWQPEVQRSERRAVTEIEPSARSDTQTRRSVPEPSIPEPSMLQPAGARAPNAFQPNPSQPDAAPSKSIELDFNLPPAKAESPSSPTSSPLPPLPAEPEPEPTLSKTEIASTKGGSLDELFAGESSSLVAIAVGSAEGTRTPHGEKNPAYYGHTDPGNGVWNLGSFSYQHGANSPEEADTKQLARLRSQAETILQKASAQGLALTLEEKLNGIDLANQAPKAVLERSGYVEWLAEAHAKGMSGSDAILWARVQSFIDPDTQTWDAPGLGNSEDRITRDQERRMLEIAKAIDAYPNPIAENSLGNRAADRNQVNHRSWMRSGAITRLFAQPFTHLFEVAARKESRSLSEEAIGVQRILEIDLSERSSAWSYP